MASALSSKLSAFINPQDASQLQELDAAVATALTCGLSQSDKEALLQVFERFPEEDGFGVFWSILHALESADNYEHELVASVRRAPNLFNTLMINRIVNAGINVLAGVSAERLVNEVLSNGVATPGVIKQVQGFLHRQASAGQREA
ncbi:hypothetical protein [Aquabacterium humicola]|uniref:hypothetical protein n=1 Tax=Aquabacterium humicola TaxID=3237377 RepID=UPI00254383C8|nr:hypothetical protein [Rubrivivax pictus]